MAKIPQEYLPSKDLWPKRIYELPEHKNIPQKFNSSEVLIDGAVAKGWGDKPALLIDEQKIPYKALAANMNKFGNALKSLGLEENDRVMLRSPNIPPAIVANFAAIKAGGIFLPTSPLFARTEIAHVANNSEAKFMIVAAAMWDEVEKALPDIKTVQHFILIGDPPAIEAIKEKNKGKNIHSYADLMKDADPKLEAVQKDRMDVSVMLYTSGTTGLPKGTVHFMEESLIVADGFGKYCWQVTENDVLASPAPIAMAAGYSAAAVIPYRFGAALSLLPRFTPEAMYENIQKHKVTILSALPTAYRKMMQVPDAAKKYDLSSLKTCTGGGEALSAQTYNEWKKMFGLEIYEGLGTTEMMFVFISGAAVRKVKPGAIGPAIPGYKLRCVTEDGKDAKPGETGMLLAQGPTGVIYWKDNDKQKGAVWNGWCRAGDMVNLDEDGYVWFLSREDDLIKSSGYRIGPEEIEEALMHHPHVLEAGVIGVPDPVMGQKTKAFVVLKPEAQPSEDLKKELVEFCRDKIAVYKLPREVEFIKELPRTPPPQFKLLRRKLRDMEKGKSG